MAIWLVAIGLGVAAIICCAGWFVHKRHAAMIIEVGMQLNATLKRRDLLPLIMKSAEQMFDAEASAVILVDETTNELYFEVATGEKGEAVRQIRLQPGEGIAGWVAQHGESIRIADAARDVRWSNRVSQRVGMPTRCMLCVPVRSGGRILGVLQVINRRKQRTFSRRQLRTFEQLAALAAIALENMLLYEALEQSMYQLAETTAAKERMESELKIAREIQTSYLPGNNYQTKACNLYADLRPAREVGGDFYHFMSLGHGRTLFCLGDVADKGMPAALFMSGLMIWIRAKAEGMHRPSEIVQRINQELSTADSTMFATMFLGILDEHSGRLQYCDAGHCPAFITGPSGTYALAGEKNMPVGVFADANYEDNEIVIKKGESIVLYSDGISEAQSEKNEWYSIEKLCAFLEKHVEYEPHQIVKKLFADVDEFSRNASQYDDMAALVVRFDNNL